MAEIKLVAETGRPTGSRPVRRLRATGKIPGVVYGQGSDPVPVTVDWKELRLALTTEAGLNALIDLEVAGETKLAIVKDLQRHPVRHDVRHVDFLLIRRDQAITIEVPVVLHGEPEGVLQAGGVVDQVLMTLTVHAKPGDIPTEIPVDVTDLEVGTAIRVGDLTMPAGVTTDVDAEEPVVTAAHGTTEADLEAEVEGEAAEGEAAEGAEGAEGGVAEGEGEAGGESGDAEG